ncbi:MAG TPA: hypothetical protein VKR52_05930 [Terracidiphilus sp.]|nr:hypothetical protein [Terracidiphilus sp.]
MFRRVGLAICYFVAGVYVLSILLPAVYCLRHGCKGPDGDAFMPAFFFTPVGAFATALCLYHSIQSIRRKSWPGLFWPLTILFSVVLLGVAALIVLFVVEMTLHRTASAH